MADTNPVFRAEIVAVDKSSAVIDKIAAKAMALGRAADAATNPWHKAVMGDSPIARAMNLSRDTGGFFGGRGGGGLSAIGGAMAGASQRAAASLWTTTAAEVAGATEHMTLFARASAMAHAAGSNVAALAEPFSHLKHPLAEVREGVAKLREGFVSVGEKVAEILPMIGALGGAASIGGLFELTHRVAEGFSELAHSAMEIGITTGAMQKLAYEAKMTDTPLESMQTGMFRLNRAIADSAAGKNKDAAGLFHHLGIATRDASGHLIAAADALPKLQEAFAHTTDPAMRARMAMVLFGRGGKEMLPFLLASKEEMKEWSEQADRVIYPFSKEDGENLEQFKRGWIGLTTSIDSFTNALGARLAPVLTPIIHDMTDWLDANREWLATEITDDVREFGGWVAKTWPEVRRAATEMWGWLDPVIQFADRWVGAKGAIEGVAAVIVGPWVLAAGRMVFTLGAITLAAGKAIWSLGTGMVDAIGLLETKMNAFNLAAASNPLLRTLMLIANVYDKMHNGVEVTQSGFDNDPEMARKHGLTRGADGKWVYPDGTVAPGEAAPAPLLPGVDPGGWLKRQWDRLPSLPDGAGMSPDGLSMPGTSGDAGGNALQLLRDAIRPGANKGAVDITVTFDNAPPGMAFTTTSSGTAADPTVDVGHAFQDGGVPVPYGL